MKRLVCLVMTFVFAILYIPAIGETKKLSGYEAFEDTAPVFAKFLLSQKWNFDFERSTVKKMYDEKENTIYLDFYIDCDLKSLKASCSGFVY
ncbi:MAG: hypothetical protein MRZ98_03840, partial [Clostridiales bacterium]|nr:hypothetical protein [Clostridiales bacterium]